MGGGRRAFLIFALVKGEGAYGPRGIESEDYRQSARLVVVSQYSDLLRVPGVVDSKQEIGKAHV